MAPQGRTINMGKRLVRANLTPLCWRISRDAFRLVCRLAVKASTDVQGRKAMTSRTALKWNPSPVNSDVSCIFCRVDDESVNTVIDQTDNFYVRHDNFPATDGHVEIVPKRHVDSFFDLTPGEVSEAYDLMRRVHKQLEAEFGPKGYTIAVNDGRAAGRTIDHLHIHIVPRYEGDVEDPRGGIRRALPNFDPDSWHAAS